MMNSKTKLAVAAMLAVVSMSTFAQAAKSPWTISGNAGLFSDYRFRGYTQTGYGPPSRAASTSPTARACTSETGTPTSSRACTTAPAWRWTFTAATRARWATSATTSATSTTTTRTAAHSARARSRTASSMSAAPTARCRRSGPTHNPFLLARRWTQLRDPARHQGLVVSGRERQVRPRQRLGPAGALRLPEDQERQGRPLLWATPSPMRTRCPTTRSASRRT